jgi:hypothetical protein
VTGPVPLVFSCDSLFVYEINRQNLQEYLCSRVEFSFDVTKLGNVQVNDFLKYLLGRERRRTHVPAESFWNRRNEICKTTLKTICSRPLKFYL